MAAYPCSPDTKSVLAKKIYHRISEKGNSIVCSTGCQICDFCVSNLCPQVVCFTSLQKLLTFLQCITYNMECMGHPYL